MTESLLYEILDVDKRKLKGNSKYCYKDVIYFVKVYRSVVEYEYT